eukprot:2402055-Rhodomonas_salina.4
MQFSILTSRACPAVFIADLSAPGLRGHAHDSAPFHLRRDQVSLRAVACYAVPGTATGAAYGTPLSA